MKVEKVDIKELGFTEQLLYGNDIKDNRIKELEGENQRLKERIEELEKEIEELKAWLEEENKKLKERIKELEK